MKKILSVILITAFIFMTIEVRAGKIANNLQGETDVNTSLARKKLINSDWLFAYGENMNAHEQDFDDSAWRKISIPHDWSVETEAAECAGGTVEGCFSTKSQGTTDTGWTIGGEAWYRYYFKTAKSMVDHIVSFYFEGVSNHCTVWINGRKVYFNPYAYSSFRVDVTPYLNDMGENNTLAIHVENKGDNSRWYQGSGIYRHVWMMTIPKLHLDEWETAISTTSIKKLDNNQNKPSSATSATIHISTAAINEQPLSVPLSSADISVMNAKGEKVSSGKIYFKNIQGNSKRNGTIDITINDAVLWSPSNPYLYTAVINMGADEITIPFGVRTLSFSAVDGFRLNGEKMLLKGGCVHHDHGILGSASYDAAEMRKVSLLKDNGFNAVRTSHNIPSEEFLNQCDRQGLLVIDEAFDQWEEDKACAARGYGDYFAEYHDRDLKTMLRRDRNHPSIIMWSIGNEIPERSTPKGVMWGKEMQSTVRQYDSRPVTNAVNGYWENCYSDKSWEVNIDAACSYTDVAGYNYVYDKYKSDHEKTPNRIMYGSETYPKKASENWRLVESEPYVIGDFVWTAIDYLGESGIGNYATSGNAPMFRDWPWYNGWCGDIDFLGEKKPQSHYRDIVWNIKPISMAVEGNFTSVSNWGWQPEWACWAPYKKDMQSVNVYSKAPKVRLYLNNELIGEATTSDSYWAGFSVNYAPGILRAVNVVDGVETDSCILKDLGEPIAIRLKQKTYTGNDGKTLMWVTAELVDANGNLVLDSSKKVKFSLYGNGSVLATGNASPNDHESFRNSNLEPKFFEGRAGAVIMVNGKLKIEATSYRLQSGTIEN